MIKKELNINGVRWKLIVDPSVSLAVLFQSQLLKIELDNGNCGMGDCKDCFVIINGEEALACTTALGDLANGTIITTKEGIEEAGALPALQLAWVIHGSPGCFYCSGKAISTGAAMLAINPFPSRKDIQSWFNQRSFKCCNSERTMQSRIDAIEDAARVVRGEIDIHELACMISTEKKVVAVKQALLHDVIYQSNFWTPVPELNIRIPPETLHLALVRAGMSNAELVAIEADEAWDVPGVYRVITFHDVLGSNYLSRPVSSSQEKGFEFNRPILSIYKEEIKNKNEVIAVVCADSRQNAFTAARKVKAKYKFLKEEASGIQTGAQNCKIVTEAFHYPQAYNLGFANLDDSGKLAIHSRFLLPDYYRSIIAWGIGLNEQQLVLVRGNEPIKPSQAYCPIVEAILGQAFLSTGRPVSLNCCNYSREKYSSVNVQWSTAK